MLELYQTAFEPRWFVSAEGLADRMISHFAASEGVQLRPEPQLPSKACGLAGFFDTSDDDETLITRPRDMQDNAAPSGNAMAVTACLKLAGLAVEARYIEIAQEALGGVQSFLGQYPLGFGQWLVALDYALSRPFEIAIVSPHDDEATRWRPTSAVISPAKRQCRSRKRCASSWREPEVKP